MNKSRVTCDYPVPYYTPHEINTIITIKRKAMPKLSLYHSEKSNNFRFIDRQISKMFQAGGTDAYLHKFLGTNTVNGTADQPTYGSMSPTNIQDLLLLENRDRTYDPEIYRLRCHYNVQNLDFNLSQFGLFIDQDTLFMTVHINDFINFVGRKPISGDVIELPHLRDDFALNEFDVSLPRYYVIEDVSRASEGFSATWYPHLYKLRITKITDSQQFSEILDLPAGEDSSLTVRDVLSSRTKELQINLAVINQAEIDTPLSGFETRQFYTLAVDPLTGQPIIETADETTLDASVASYLASENSGRPLRTGYTGYLVGDGFPVNGYDFGIGVQFPAHAGPDDYFLRIDFMPNRLFRFDGTLSAWVKIEDAVRMSMTNNDTRQTLKSSFINNKEFTYNDSVGVDIVDLVVGATIIKTNINFTTAIYAVIKIYPNILDYEVSLYPGLITGYFLDGVEKVQINLPMIDLEQQTIPYDGSWNVTLYNYREAQRGSLSTALIPDANF